MKKPFLFAATIALALPLAPVHPVLAQSAMASSSAQAAALESPAAFASTSSSAADIVAVAESNATRSSAGDDATFRALGEKIGIEKIVKDLLAVLLADSRIKNSFKDVDMERLSLKLQEQICMLAGGPCKYTGKDMTLIHEDLKITNAQFNALAEDLQTAMDRQGVPPQAQNKLVAKMAPMQRQIVTR
jgi:hemoglobin